jgi:hypothetical protein
LLATAINYANNLMFALAFMLLAVWLQAAASCRRNLATVRLAGRLAEAGFRRRVPVSSWAP